MPDKTSPSDPNCIGLAYGSGDPDRLSEKNPGPLMPCGPIRGVLLLMLERLPIATIRKYWQTHSFIVDGRELSEAELYRFLWESREGMRQVHMEMVYGSLQYFLWREGIAMEDFVDERFYRLEQGGIWKSSENIAWSKDFLPKLFLDPEPMLTLEHLLCHFCMQAIPGADCQIPYLKKDENWIETVFSFALDANFRFRNVFLYSHISLVGAQIFPSLFGLPKYEKARMLADCLHPDHILWGRQWEIKNAEFLIEGEPYGQVVRFSEWAKSQSLQFHGINIPDRDVILINRDYLCPFRNSTALISDCVYDAPLYLSRIGYSRKPRFEQFGGSTRYLDQILGGLTRDDSEAWQRLETSYRSLLGAAEEKLIFEYRANSQALFLNGKSLIRGVPAKIFRKVLVAGRYGQTDFDFRTFKYDLEIFPSSKGSSFETRWNRLRDRLAETTTRARLEKTGKGEFAFAAECPVELLETD